MEHFLRNIEKQLSGINLTPSEAERLISVITCRARKEEVRKRQPASRGRISRITIEIEES